MKRLNEADALQLLKKTPLGELMNRAHAVRMQKHPEGLVTFVCDTNPNYTNVCVTACRFCAFHRNADSRDAYTLSPARLAERVMAAVMQGATTVLLQGGHNPAVSLADWLAYLRAIRKVCPSVHIHPFSPTEALFMAEREGVPVKDVLLALRREGIDTMPGGGAELLSDAVRSRISPAKCSARQWLEVTELAHELGFKTTATLMYGHVETHADVIEHLFSLRRLQDKTGGFSSFVPWSFKPGGTSLAEEVPKATHPARYIRMIAIARLVLDNFPHVQSSLFSEGPDAGALGLFAGADDLGGILIEENVLRQAGHARPTTVADVVRAVRREGFKPARRNSHYEIVESY